MARMRDETLRGLKLDEDQAEGVQDPGSGEAAREKECLDNKELNPQDKVKKLEAELTQAKAKADENYERLLRLQAEFDNYRKRTQKEKAEIINYAVERLVGELLPVLDNFERAACAAKANSDIAAFSQGVEMILRQLQNVLSKEGLKAVEAVGQPFDPNIHEAVLRIDSEEHPENTVVEELQKGYYLKEKVLRPSMVKVCN